MNQGEVDEKMNQGEMDEKMNQGEVDKKWIEKVEKGEKYSWWENEKDVSRKGRRSRTKWL